jgi:hypothetical protein
MRSSQIITALLLIASPAAADPPVFAEARPVPEMNALFEQKDNWIGGDGDYSVALTPERTLWLFSDTWIGSVRNGHRTNAAMVNNTLALEDGHGAGAKIQFIVRHDADGKPTAFLTPENKRGWFWPQSAACIGQRLFMFLAQEEKTDAGGAFGFRQIGRSLGVVTNALAPPFEWRVEQHPLPCADFSAKRQLTFGAANVIDGEFLYIYGTDEDKPSSRERYLILARVPTNQVADFSAWRYYAEGRWVVDYHEASRLADRMATECSVSFLPKFGQYLLVYTDRGLSPKIEVRTAPTPWGKWSAPTTVFECPETRKHVFCYAAKAHPSEDAGDGVVISYVANAFDFSQVMADASLYWPRFIRLPLARGERLPLSTPH